MTGKFYRLSADEFREKAGETGFELLSSQHGMLDGHIYYSDGPVEGLPAPDSGEADKPVFTEHPSTMMPQPFAERIRRLFGGC